MDLETRKAELADLQAKVTELEAVIRQEEAGTSWQAEGFYGAYSATTGFMLGKLAAIVSLLVNVIAAPIAARHPLELIRVYLTFPLGEKALQLTSGSESVYVVGDGVIVAFGCCLYIVTGAVLGMLIQVVLSRLVPTAPLSRRIVVASICAVLLWAVGFYGILSWLQPAFFGGNWITDSQVLPWWVALLTHLVFGCTMAFLFPWGQYQPYVRPTSPSLPAPPLSPPAQRV